MEGKEGYSLFLSKEKDEPCIYNLCISSTRALLFSEGGCTSLLMEAGG